MATSPRCGKPLRWSEPPGWGAVTETPVCGYRKGHRGRHRSEMALVMQARRRAAYDRPSGSPAVGAAIREARVRAGRSQSGLAVALGVTQQCVANWEAAKRTPAPETWEQLELTLGPLGIVRDPGPEAAEDQQRGESSRAA